MVINIKIQLERLRLILKILNRKRSDNYLFIKLL